MPALSAFVVGLATDGTDLTLQCQGFVEGSPDYLSFYATVSVGSTPTQVNAAIKDAAVAAAQEAEFVIGPNDLKSLFAHLGLVFREGVTFEEARDLVRRMHLMLGVLTYTKFITLRPGRRSLAERLVASPGFQFDPSGEAARHAISVDLRSVRERVSDRKGEVRGVGK
jgi:hypothetical protein